MVLAHPMWQILIMNPSITLTASPLAPIAPSRGLVRLVRLGLLALALVGAQSASAQAIYAATEHAEPDGVISVRGDSLGMDTEFTVYPFATDGTRKAGVKVAPSQANGIVAMVRIPKSSKGSMYELVAQTARGKTNSVFLNRPRMMWTDVGEAMPGNVVRIIGRNLRPFESLTPEVTLTNAQTGAKILGRLSFQDDSNVNFVVPDNTPVGNYTLSINNALAGPASVDAAHLSLSVVAKKADPFNLGVSWGGELNAIAANVFNAKTDSRLSLKAVGDGIADDTAAINDAIVKVFRSGGGTLYLPAGTYKLGDVVVIPNVVLKGAGKGQTVLKMGSNFTPNVAPNGSEKGITLWGEGTGRVGIADLTIVNLNANAKPNYVVRTGPSYGLSTKLFIKNVSVFLLNGRPVITNLVRKGVIADSEFSATCADSSALIIGDVQEFQMVRNTVDYRAGRTAVSFGKRVVIEDNKIRIDNAYQVPGFIETGGIETSYSQQVLISNNDVGGYNGSPTKQGGDLEMIGTQASNVPDYGYVGMVKMASGRLLMPTGNWATTTWQAPNYASLPRMTVLITSGKGAGQWRWATTWSSNAVMVDRPWQVNPDGTSRFALAPLTTYAQTIIDNDVHDGSDGVMLYQGAVDCAVTGNVIRNAGKILLRGDSRIRTVNRSNFGFFPILDVTVMHNEVTAPNGLRPASITCVATDVSGNSFGTLVSGADVRYNTVVGSNRPWADGEAGKNDGIDIASVFFGWPKPDYVNQVGTVAEGNTVSQAVRPISVRGTIFGEMDNDPVLSVTP